MSPNPFDLDSIKKAVKDTLDADIDIPEGHRGAAVAVANGEKIEVVVATRVMKDGKLEWDIEGVFSHDWTGDHKNSVGVINKVTW